MKRRVHIRDSLDIFERPFRLKLFDIFFPDHRVQQQILMHLPVKFRSHRALIVGGRDRVTFARHNHVVATIHR